MFPNDIDYDKLVFMVLRDFGSAISDWLKGAPKDEIVLMNNLTRYFARVRRNCDIGINTVISVETEVYELHRKGKAKSDLYGSDLAVTVGIKNIGFLKTALFQLKKSANHSAIIDKTQLLSAVSQKQCYDRSFVLAVDEIKESIRLMDFKSILSQYDIDKGNIEKTFSTGNWQFLSTWLYEWMSCNIGPVSDPNDNNSIETLLKKYAVSPPISHWESQEPDINHDDIIPAKVWLQVNFKGQ